jgi:hypothetical protein
MAKEEFLNDDQTKSNQSPLWFAHTSVIGTTVAERRLLRHVADD